MTVLLLASCKNENETNSTADTASQNIDTVPTQQDGNIVPSAAFNPETIPESTADIGEFPYYTVPDWLKTGSYSNEREQDFNLFEFSGKINQKRLKYNIHKHFRQKISPILLGHLNLLPIKFR